MVESVKDSIGATLKGSQTDTVLQFNLHNPASRLQRPAVVKYLCQPLSSVLERRQQT
jgi:hypothetical protein